MGDEKPTCNIAGCERPAWALGMCGTHYQRQRTSGNAEPSKRAFAVLRAERPEERWVPVPGLEHYMVSDAGRIWSFYGNGRLLRPAQTRAGRRAVRLDGRTVRVSRVVLEAFVGPCPPGMEACHGNDLPSDDRLANLRWDTHSANELDKTRNYGRVLPTHCIRHHELSGRNVYTPPGGGQRMCRKCMRIRNREAYRRRKERDGAMTHGKMQARAAEAVRRVIDGETQAAVAADLGIDPSTVSHMIRGKTWRRLLAAPGT